MLVRLEKLKQIFWFFWKTKQIFWFVWKKNKNQPI